MAGIPQRPDPATPPRAPRWVKVSGISALVVVLLIIVLLVGGGHTPRRHFGPSGGHSPPAGHMP
ncbi:MAG: hypothetical protein ACRDJ4_05190 [Actinomycetota bacterium]